MSVKFVLSTLCVASLCSASALGACKPQLSDLDESFGVGQLGRPYTELLPAIKPLEFSQRGDPRCVGVNRTRFDCQFVDASGIFYEDDGEYFDETSQRGLKKEKVAMEGMTQVGRRLDVNEDLF